MDPSLLREREAFKARAMKLPTVEKRKIVDDEKSKPSKKPKSMPKPPRPKEDFDYKSVPASSQNKFSLLTKIVKFMRTRHQDGHTHPLTIEDILDEANMTDIGARQKHWLVTEALPQNPKIDIVDGDSYKYKPKLNISSKKGLLRLLDKHDQKGFGGIMYDDVEEAVPKAEKAMKALGDNVISIKRPDKKEVLYYNDKSCSVTVDEELVKLWRGVTVDGVDEGKIDDYLRRQGITSMQDVGLKVMPAQKKRNNRKRKMLKTNNEHMGDVLQDYSEK